MTAITFWLPGTVTPGWEITDPDGDTIGTVTEVEFHIGDNVECTAEIDGSLGAGDVVDALRLHGAFAIDLVPRARRPA